MKKIYEIYTRSKCGGTWVAGAFTGIGIKLGRSVWHNKQTNLIKDNKKDLSVNNYDFIISQNSSFKNIESILSSEHKGIHIIRDPRGITVSVCFSYKDTHRVEERKQIADFRNKLKLIDLKIINFNESFFEKMQDWNYRTPSILEFKFEDFTQDPLVYFIISVKHFDLLEEANLLKTALFNYKGYLIGILLLLFL